MGNGVQFINSVFGKRMRYVVARGTAFASMGPSRLPWKNAVFGVKTSSLRGSGVKSVYQCGGDRTSVAMFSYGRGKVIYLGFDWFATVPGTWHRALGAALKMAGGSSGRPSRPRPSGSGSRF